MSRKSIRQNRLFFRKGSSIMKLAACVMILTSAVFAGVSGTRRLNRRVESLDDSIALVEMIRTRVVYFREPLSSVFITLRESSCLLQDAPDGDFTEVWRCVCDQMRAPEREILIRFGAQLGASDVEGQNALCRQTAERLRQVRTDADAAKKQFSRLGAVLPVCAAAALILLVV